MIRNGREARKVGLVKLDTLMIHIWGISTTRPG